MGLDQATQGPWTHNEGNPTRIIGPDAETVAVLYGGAVGIDQQFANAGLVVATPVLYAYVGEQASSGDANAKQIVDSLDGDGTSSSPWHYDDWNPRRIIDADSTTIASVFGGLSGDLGQLANAKLISAAPAMRDYVQAKSDADDEGAKAVLEGIGAA
jgi:hypothetical protein